jgi:hypothetical protein
VGDHLLLGGDNIDLTLAKIVEGRLTAADGARRLDPLEWHGLVHACRLAKETLLGNPEVDRLPIAVSGRGSKLIGSTLRDELGREELERVLFDGFFPAAAREERPRRSRGGLHEFGLPYAADAAITRHLAAFLTRHGIDRVDVLLFNGGAMAPPSLRQRVRDQIAAWQPDAGAPRNCPAARPSWRSPRGPPTTAWSAAAGRAHRRRHPRSFYVGVAGSDARIDRAVCLAPRGLEEDRRSPCRATSS